jgi:2,4-didehydro-3-deoxy-L-rhamnonate hydrolase
MEGSVEASNQIVRLLAHTNANIDDLVLGVRELIEMASSFYTLHPGEVILMKTPQGVGSVLPGDVLRARMDSIGEMHVDVRAGK